jgi:hypothetical protein
MTARTPPTRRAPKYRLELETIQNGRMGKTTVHVLDADDKIIQSDHFDLRSGKGRTAAADALAAAVPGASARKFRKDLERLWNDSVNERRRMRQQAEAGSPEAAHEPPASCVEVLLALASRAEYCHGHDGRPYATVPVGASRAVARWLPWASRAPRTGRTPTRAAASTNSTAPAALLVSVRATAE